jgi:hypothetical protein
MPQVVADYGPTLLVKFPDGSQQEMIRESYERMFPGGAYPEPPAGPAPLPAGLQPSANALGGPPAPAGGPPSMTEARPAALGAPTLPQAPPEGASPPGAAAATGPVGAAAPVPSGAREASAPTLPQVTAPSSGRQSLRQFAQRTTDFGQARMDAAQALGDAQELEATQMARALEQHDARATRLEEQKLKAHKEGMKAADARAAEIDKLADEHGKMRIDRGRLYANMSTFDKVLAGIGFGLTAMSQAKTGQGGPNAALQIIGNAVENDVRDQQAMIDQAGKRIDTKRTLYKDFMERLGNKQAAYDMTIATGLAQAKRQVEIIGAQSQSAKVRAQSVDLAAQLGQQIADKLENVRQTAGAEAYRNAQLKASQANAEVEARLKAAELRKKEADATAAELEVSGGERARKLGVGELVRDDGRPVLFRSTESAEKVANSQGAAKLATQLIDKLLVARKQHGWSSDLFKSDEWRQMQGDYSQLQLAKKTTDELGVLAGPDMDLIERALGTSDPTEVRDPTAGLENARNNLVAQFNARAQSQVADGNIQPWEPPRLRALEAFEAGKGENVKAFLAPLPPGVKAGPAASKEVADEKQALLPALLREASPAELNSMLAHVDVMAGDGVLTKSQAEKMRSAIQRRIERGVVDRPLTPDEAAQRVRELDINLR